jgi:TfoX/Sxy family transcriptional regulator of competence genes
MHIPKPSDADKEHFRDLVPDDSRVEVKPMFGNLGAFVNGNMFIGLFGPDVGVKLAGGDADELIKVHGAGPFGPPERPMGGYVTLPPSLAGTTEGQRWIRRSLEHVAGLPPKKPRA